MTSSESPRLNKVKHPAQRWKIMFRYWNNTRARRIGSYIRSRRMAKRSRNGIEPMRIQQQNSLDDSILEAEKMTLEH